MVKEVVVMEEGREVVVKEVVKVVVKEEGVV